MDSNKIGKFINIKRKEKNMSQSELAHILNVTSQAVSKWENGRGIPDIEMLKKLSEVFEINIDELLNGEENKKKNKLNKRIFIYSLVIVVIILLSVILVVLNSSEESFKFSTLASDNDAFSIKGVIAYTKDKKSIYISEVNKREEDKELYKSIECILYETNGNTEKLINKIGEIKEENNELSTLTELLKGVEFNIDNYDCSCQKEMCNNLYVRINAKNKENKIITYEIPIQLERKCSS